MIMSAAISPSNPRRVDIPPAPSLAHMRVAGGITVNVENSLGRSTVTRLHESDGYKARLVRRSDPPEMIIVNTGGGLASGDRVHQNLELGEAAAFTMTTQAAERCYRSNDGGVSHVEVQANVANDAVLNWLPQETILFDNARLTRSIDVALAATARILMTEIVVFGRRAMGEQLTGGLFNDRWRVRRDGKLIFAENVHLCDTAFQVMSLPAMAHGAHATLTLLLAAPDAEDWLASARSVVADAPFDCAASAWDGKLVVRGLAARPEDVRRLMQSLIPALGGPPLPRAWST